jgi:hypothetical protein
MLVCSSNRSEWFPKEEEMPVKQWHNLCLATYSELIDGFLEAYKEYKCEVFKIKF